MVPPPSSLELPDRAATAAFARRLARALVPGDMVGLGGDLGAGKTTLVRDLIAALAGTPVEVPSPTYTLVQTYALPAFTLTHVDLYRLEAAAEIAELGLDDARADGVLVIEWFERLHVLPADRLEITLEIAGADARRAHLVGHGAWGLRVRDLTAADDG